MASFLDFLFGSKDKMKQQSVYSPQQQRGLSQFFQNPITQSPLYQQGSDFLTQLLSSNPELMNQFQEPYLQNFQQNVVPDIANRFAGLGTGSSGLSSSGFQQTLAQAGRGLQSDLAAMRGQMQLQGLGQGLQYAQQPYSNILGGLGQRPFENVYQPGSTGLVGGILQGLGGGLGQGFGSNLGKGIFG